MVAHRRLQVLDLAYLPSSNLIATSGEDNYIAFWDQETMERRSELESSSLRLSHSSDLSDHCLFSLTRDMMTVQLIDLNQLTCSSLLTTRSGPIGCLTIDPINQMLITASTYVDFFDLRSNKIAFLLSKSPSSERIPSVLFRAHSHQLVVPSTSYGSQITIYDIRNLSTSNQHLPVSCSITKRRNGPVYDSCDLPGLGNLFAMSYSQSSMVSAWRVSGNSGKEVWRFDGRLHGEFGVFGIVPFCEDFGIENSGFLDWDGRSEFDEERFGFGLEFGNEEGTDCCDDGNDGDERKRGVVGRVVIGVGVVMAEIVLRIPSGWLICC